jgi:hypothetical protein
MTVSLALWIGLLPLFSAVHLAMVPHVYWSEHGHLHEVVTVGETIPAEDTNRATASIFGQPSAFSFASLEECPFVDLAIRQGVVTSGWLPPNLFNNTGWQIFAFSSVHVLRPILDRAPKHSPPLRTA